MQGQNFRTRLRRCFSIRINAVELTNFRKLKDQRIEFTENLNLIEGPNNAGKSSIMYAIYFALTGEAFNFRSPKNYISFDESKMKVRLEFESSGTEYYVESVYSESGRENYEIGAENEVLEATENGAKVNEVRNTVYELSGLDKRRIENVVYAAQQKFIDKIEGGRQQQEAIDYIFDIKQVDVLSEAFEEVIEKKKTRLEGREELVERKAEIEERAEELEEQIEEKNDSLEQINDNIEERAENLESVEEELSEINADLEELDELQSLKKKIDNKHTLLDDTVERKKKIEQRHESGIRNKIQTLQERSETYNDDLEELQKNLENLQEMKTERVELEKDIENLEKNADKLQQEQEELSEGLKELKEAAGAIQDKISEIAVDSDHISQAIEDVGELLQELREQRAAAKNSLEGLLKTHEEGECDVCGREIENPDKYHQKINDKEDEIVQLQKAISDKEERLESLEELRELEDERKEFGKEEKDLVKQKKEVEEDLDKIENQLDVKEQKQEMLDEKLDEDRFEKLKAERKEIQEGLSNIQKKLNNAENDLEALEEINERIEKLEEDIVSLEKKVDEKEVKGAPEALKEGKEKLAERKTVLETRIKSDNERKQEIQQTVKQQEKVWKNHQEDLEKIVEQLEQLDRLKKQIENAEQVVGTYSDLKFQLRDNVISELENRVFHWYQDLAASKEFRQLTVDRDDYSLKGVPIEADREYSVSDYQGGGQRTLTALAYQLALAEMTDTGFMMIDEPTDATDTDNRESLLEIISEAVSRFSQIILITHHGVGREKAQNIVRVKPVSGGESEIVQPLN